jgi:hypothetical protein
MLHPTSRPSPGVAAIRAALGRAAAAAALLLPLLLTACVATPPRPAGEPPAVELGPVIRLLELPTSSEQVRALIDDAGLAHVLVASPGDRTLRHLVVDAAGTIPLAEVVRSDVKPASLDAAFDAAGRLHMLAGTQHLVREPAGGWSEAATPWAAAGLEAGTARFVTGGVTGGPLVYAFDVKGKALGAPTRWDLYGIGGYGGGIIWPWRTRGSRLAVVAEDGGRYDAWSVVDLDDNEDVADWSVVASPDGRVHVVYDAQRSVLALQSLARYVCIDPVSADDASRWREIAGRRVRSVAGTDMPVAPEQPGVGPGAALGFNPATSEMLLVRPHDGGRVLRDGAWGPVALLPLELAFDPRLVPRAAGGFDVVVIGSRPESPSGEESPVFYLQFRDGGWSAPVEVGGAKVDSFFGSVWDAVQIASDGQERVFVTWPVRGGIEGRWVRVRGE